MYPLDFLSIVFSAAFLTFIFLLGQTYNFTVGFSLKDVDGRSELSFLVISIRAQSGEQQTAFGQDQRELSQCAWMRTSNPWLKGSNLCTDFCSFLFGYPFLAFLCFLRKLRLWSVWWIGMGKMCLWVHEKPGQLEIKQQYSKSYAAGITVYTVVL